MEKSNSVAHPLMAAASRTALFRATSIEKVCAIQIVECRHRGEFGNKTCDVARICSGSESNDKGKTKSDGPRCEPYIASKRDFTFRMTLMYWSWYISIIHLRLRHDILAINQTSGTDNVEDALPADGTAAVLRALVYWRAIKCQGR